jgi:hypothetical protein
MRRNNRIRAGWASAAVEAFAEQTHQDTSGDLENDKPTVVGDLLANLMHYCDVYDMSFEDALSTARMHYEAEQSGAEDSWRLEGEELHA